MDKSQKAVAVFDKLAELYQNKFMDQSGFIDTFELFCKSIPQPHARILEIACGPGNITRYLLNMRPDFQILGIDLAPRMVALAKTNNPTAQFEVMDARGINQLPGKFDGILCGFGLPYLSREEAIQLIRHSADLLNNSGIIYLSTMEDDYSKSGLRKGSSGDEIYMHYHQADYLTTALEENGFQILSIQRKDYPEQNGDVTTDLVIIGCLIKF
ncbi:MAG: methyltransferase domain-containing protein [Bacteroidia bacterium]